MKKSVSVMVLAAVAALSILCFGSVASAEDIKMVGVITKIEMSADATTAVATLKDKKSEALVPITVNDELTLDKFKDHRIVEEDEIRCKYEVIDGKNVSKLFKKTAGC